MLGTVAHGSTVFGSNSCLRHHSVTLCSSSATREAEERRDANERQDQNSCLVALPTASVACESSHSTGQCAQAAMSERTPGAGRRARHLSLGWQHGETQGSGFWGKEGDKDTCWFPIWHLPAAPSVTPTQIDQFSFLWINSLIFICCTWKFCFSQSQKVIYHVWTTVLKKKKTEALLIP